MKNNKNFLSLTFLVLVLIFISACSAKNISENDKNEGDEKTLFRRPDFGQPEERAEIMGLVKSVIGNEVTILKIERPERSGENGERNEWEAEDGKNIEGEKTPAIQMGASGGRIPGMGRGMRSGGGDSEQQAQMIEAMKKMSTGEEKVIIPVGIRMLKKDEASTEKPNMIEASLTDVKQDKMLQIWLDDDFPEKKIASFVMVMQ